MRRGQFCVVNTDNVLPVWDSVEGGHHWLTVCREKDHVLVFDSFGRSLEQMEQNYTEPKLKQFFLEAAVSPTFTHTGIPPLSSGSVFDKSDNQSLYNIFYLCSTQSGILAHIINTITCTSEIPRNFLALECLQC